MGALPVAVATGAHSAWVLNQGDQTVSQIGARTRRVVKTIALSTDRNAAIVSITFGFNEASVKITTLFDQMYLGQLSVPQATSQAVQQANQAVQAASTGG